MTNLWFRSWHGAPTDPKWLGIAKSSGVAPGIVVAIVWALLDRASQAEDRGNIADYDADGLACFFGCEPEQVNAIVTAMQSKGVLDGNKFSSWEKRQPKRDDGAAGRAKEWRERKRTQTNANEQDQTQPNNGYAENHAGEPIFHGDVGYVHKHEQEYELNNPTKSTRTQTNANERKRTLDTDTDTDKKDSVAYATDANRASRVGLALAHDPEKKGHGLDLGQDPRAELFGRGLITLENITGKPNSGCRSLIGRWLKAVDDEAIHVLAAIDCAAADRVADPVPWITARLGAYGRGPPGKPMSEADRKSAATKAILQRLGEFDGPATSCQTPDRAISTDYRVGRTGIHGGTGADIFAFSASPGRESS